MLSSRELNYSVVGILMTLPILYYFAGRAGPVTTADLWAGMLRYVPVWAVVWGATYLMRLLLVKWPPLAQVLLCAPVGLIGGLIIIFALAPLRRTALELFDILKELVLRRACSNKANQASVSII